MYILNNIMEFRVPCSAFQLVRQKGTIILIIDVFLLYNPIYLRGMGLEYGTGNMEHLHLITYPDTLTRDSLYT